MAMGHEQNTNLINQLRLELSVPIGKGKDSFEAATLHVAKTNDGIIDDWQGFFEHRCRQQLRHVCRAGLHARVELAICLWV